MSSTSTRTTRAAAAATTTAPAPAATATTTTGGTPTRNPGPPPPMGGAGGGGGGAPHGGGGGGAGGGGGGVPPGGGGGGGAAPPAFALTPSQAVQGPIDYTTRHGQRLFENNTSPLSMTYDLEAEKLLLFLDMVKERSNSANWAFTAAIPMAGGGVGDFFDNFGSISVETLRNYANTFVGTPTRRAQDSLQMYHCLHGSLTDETRIRVNDKREQFMVTPVGGGASTPEGLMYLKAICATAQVDTIATTTQLMKTMASLDYTMTSQDSNVKEFNMIVNRTRTQLLGRGERLTDSQLLVYLFKGYLACQDKGFIAYINGLKDQYEDGRYQTNPNALMTVALNKYDLMVEAGQWKEGSSEEKQIVALQASFDKLSKALTKTKKKAKKEKQKSDSSSDEEKQNDGKKKKQKDKKSKYPAWKLKPAGPNEPETKTVNGKTYYWCKHHQMWAAHHPSKCEMGKKQQEGLQPNTAALAAINDDDDRSI